LEDFARMGRVGLERIRWLLIVGRSGVLVAVFASAIALPAKSGGVTDSSSSPIAFTRSDSADDVFTVDATSGRVRRLTSHSPPQNGYAWRSDSTLTYVDYENNVWGVEREGGHARLLIPHLHAPGSDIDVDVLSWSPDGQQLAAASAVFGDGIVIYNLPTRQARLLRIVGSDAKDPSWSPDGSRMAFVRSDGVYVLTVATRVVRRVTPGDDPAWAPDGTRLVVSDECLTCSLHSDQLFVVNTDGSGRRRLTASSCWAYAPTWAPRSFITFSRLCQDTTDARAVEPDSTGERSFTTLGSGVAWTPSGDRFVVTTKRGRLLLVDGQNQYGRELVTPPLGGAYAPVWAADGKLVYATDDGELRILEHGATYTEPIAVDPTSWAPDSTRLLAEDADNIVLVNTKTRRYRAVLTDTGAGDPSKCSAAWSPDGKWILYGQSPESGLIGRLNARTMRDAPLPHAVYGDDPAWSPNGREFAYDTGAGCSGATRKTAIYLVRSDGRGAHLLARNAFSPTFSPDGSRIAFVRLVDVGNSELFVMNRDGTHQRRLTHHPGADSDPSWRS
jgi:Tol biopolymer transport system component